MADQGESALQGSRVSGFGDLVVKKGRVISQDLGGKSGGFRLWWLEESSTYRLIHVYTHHEAPSERDIQRTVRQRLGF